MAEPKRYFINNLPDHQKAKLNKASQKLRTEALVDTILQNFSISPANCDGGLYVGLSGVSYMLYHLSKISELQPNQDRYMQKAAKYLELPLHFALKAEKSGHITDKTGFLTGNIGVYAIAAAVYKKIGKMKESEAFLSHFINAKELLKPLNWFPNGGDELFVGRAGFLCGVLWLRKELGIEVIPDTEVHQMLNVIVESGRKFSLATKSPIPLMYHYYGTHYLGAAHGLAGILFVLLSFPEWLHSNPEALQLVRGSVDRYLQLQTPSGNFPCAMDEIGGGGRPPQDELVHWCHGAPGAIYLFAKAYLVFKDENYLNACLKCGEVTWQKGLLKKGPGICHGVSGSGYVFLVLFQLTQKEEYFERAAGFMDFMYSETFKRARQPDCPFSLYEGLAGTACFAGDLLRPEVAVFPFFHLHY